MRRSAAETREHVLAVTHELFYRRGIRAVGVDRIASESSVGPTTLYRLFPSKDVLVAAYVRRADRLYRAWFTPAAATDGRSARQRILAVFDALGEHLVPATRRGCPFHLVLAEFPDPQLAAHRLAVAHERWVRHRFHDLTAELAREADVADPAALADHLTLVAEGALAMVAFLEPGATARAARSLVLRLLPPEP